MDNKPKFIEVETTTGNRLISIDQIASIESSFGSAKITLKAVEEGENVTINIIETYEDFKVRLSRIASSD